MIQLDIVSGQATAVQLGADGKMRVFIRGEDGRESDYDFPSAEVGVREGQRVVIVRASDTQTQPASLVLLNVATGEREEYHDAFAHFTERPPSIGPRWSAALIAAGIGVVFFFYFMLAARMGAFGGFFWAVFTAFVLYWPIWGLTWTYGKITAPIRAERARNAIRTEIEARMAAHVRVPTAQATTQQTTTQGGSDGGTG